MIFRNTFKLLFTNFNLTYKVLIYRLIILLLSLGVAGTIAVPVITHLIDINYFGFLTESVLKLFETINLGNVFITIKDVFLKTIEVINSLDSSLLINAILSISVFVLIYGLIGDLCELSVIDCLNSNMSSKTRLSFFKSLVAKSFKSLGKTIINFVLSLPFYAIIVVILYFGFSYYDSVSQIGKILIPMAMFLSLVLFSGLHLSIFAGFSPSIIINDEGLFKDLNTGFRTIRKKYFRVLSTSIMTVFILYVCNLLIAVYSFFAGLIFTLPISYLVIRLFKIIAYYESNGMRYYVGDGIRTPLKKEEQDKINKMKYIV